MRVIAIPELASFDPEFTMYKGFTDAWPSAGPGGVVLGKEYVTAKFTPMGAWGLPAINTLLLLTSGATVTWAHWGLLKKNRKQLVIGLFLTVLLGITFLICQAMEYHHAYTEMGLTLRRRCLWRYILYAYRISRVSRNAWNFNAYCDSIEKYEGSFYPFKPLWF